MIHDIVAEFSFSKWQSHEQRFIPSDKQVGDFKEYHVVVGSNFSFSYNETLDSATIVLSHIPLRDRLIGLKQSKVFKYVRVYDKNNPGTLDKVFLVDNYTETETNIYEHIYSYTINLMSETKLLEKYQCPNLVVTHDVLMDGSIRKKTIYEVISRYVELYSPKVKFTSDNENWVYERVFRVPTQYEDEGKFYNKFNVPCADLALTTPTFRQLLTTLMQQVGCIPTLKNGTIGFLDFQQEAVPLGGGDYTINNTVMKISRSLSSDSYANTLVNISSNILDQNNEVISESIGFRDKESVLLKKQSNLRLQTRFPIYKVNKFVLKNIMGDGYVRIPQTWQAFWIPEEIASRIEYNYDFYPFLDMYLNLSEKELWIVDTRAHSQATASEGCRFDPAITIDGISYNYWCWFIFNPKIHVLKINFSGTIEESLEEVAVLGNGQGEYLWENPKYNPNTGELMIIIGPGPYGWFSTYLTFSNSVISYLESQGLQDGEIALWIEGDMIPYLLPNLNSTFLNAIPYPNWEQYGSSEVVLFRGRNTNDYPYYDPQYEAKAILEYDLTPLLVESSQRGNLETDFTLLSNVEVIGKTNNKTGLADFVYGTVGYSIGSNVISGFSEMYTVGNGSAFGWLEYNYTYFENILNFLVKKNIEKTVIKYSSNFDFSYFEENYPLEIDFDTNIVGIDIDVKNFFTFAIFDIVYQPLNSFNLSFVKQDEDIPLNICQLNTSENGTSDFDRFVLHQQEQVDRIGEEILIVSQRTRDFNEIADLSKGPIYFLEDVEKDGIYEEDKYLIFETKFSIANNCYNVSYTGSKSAILKYYFTSIRTKYRAYQYVDYSQSVIRKDNKTVFVCLSETGYFDGDDNIRIGDWNNNDNINDYSYFIDGINLKNNNKKIINVYERELGIFPPFDNTYRNEISVITSSKMFAIIYEDFENESPGIQIQPDAENQNLGGIPQQWYLFGVNFNDHPQLIYSFSNGYEYLISQQNVPVDTISNEIKEYAKSLPLDNVVDDTFLTTETNFVAFTLCDDKSTGSIRNSVFTSYKDRAEQMQRTLQFIYYSDSNNIRVEEAFIANGTYVNKEKDIVSIKYIELEDITEFKTGSWMVRELRTETISETLNDLTSVITLKKEGTVSYIEVDWENVTEDVIKVIGIVRMQQSLSDTSDFYDMIAFKRPSSGFVGKQKFYVTLNDTKTFTVMSKRNGILFNNGEVARNTYDRVLKDTFTYQTGNLPTGLNYVRCYKASDDSRVYDGDVLDKGEEIYFKAEAENGYEITFIYDENNPIEVATNIIGVNFVSVSLIPLYNVTFSAAVISGSTDISNFEVELVTSSGERINLLQNEYTTTSRNIQITDIIIYNFSQNYDGNFNILAKAEKYNRQYIYTKTLTYLEAQGGYSVKDNDPDEFNDLLYLKKVEE